MGGNEIVLVNREYLPESGELELGLRILNAPHVRGDQLGLIHEGDDRDGGIGVKIIDNNSRDYLPVCGGLTQVFGRAYSDLQLGRVLDIELPGGLEEVDLEMELGTFPVSIRSGSGLGNVVSVMDSFLDKIYEDGVEQGSVAGVRSFRVGHFFVTFAEEISREYPDANFHPLDEYTKGLLINLQREYREVFHTGKPNRDFAIVDPSKEGGMDGGLIFPHDPSRGLIEQSCGSGTVAVVVALAESGEVSGSGTGELEFASGGEKEVLGGPESTRVEFQLTGGRVESISFTHSLVEVLARGELFLPER